MEHYRNTNSLVNIPVPLAWLGTILVTARKERNLSQGQLASLLGAHQSVVARWETEGYRSVNLERLVQVASALEFEISLWPRPKATTTSK